MKTDFHFMNGGKFISRGCGRHPARVLDSAELIYVLSGRLGIFEDNISYDLGPGEFLLLHPGKRHGGTKAYPASLSFFWGHFTGSRKALERLPGSGKAHSPDRFSIYFERLLVEQKEADHAVSCDLLLALLLHETTRVAQALPAVPLDDRLAESAMQILQLHFAEPLSTSKTASELNCNPDYLGRVFHRRFNCTLTEALNRIRLEKAGELLSRSPFSIKETVFACGFNDPAYFRRLFFRRFSMTPSEYRKAHGTIHVNTE